MKKNFLTLTIIATVALNSAAQKAPGNVNVLYDAAVFIESTPQMPYRHVGNVECSILSPDKFDLMMKHMITKRVPKAFPEAEFDAIIFRPGSGFRTADVVKFYKPKDQPKKARKSKNDSGIDPEFLKSHTLGKNGLNLFIENSPTGNYDVLGKVELTPNFDSIEYQEIIGEMIRVSKMQYPDMNGIIFTPESELSQATVIKI